MYNSYKQKYLKYKNKYLSLKNNCQTGGTYLFNINDDNNECVICSNNITDLCASCFINGNNFCPIPRPKNDETNPSNCLIYIGDCGHCFHYHCLDKYNKGRNYQIVPLQCPICKKKWNPVLTPSPSYVWASGIIDKWKIDPLLHENENGGKWKQVSMLELVNLLKNKQSIANYISENINLSDAYKNPENYPSWLKKYEESIKK